MPSLQAASSGSARQWGQGIANAADMRTGWSTSFALAGAAPAGGARYELQLYM